MIMTDFEILTDVEIHCIKNKNSQAKEGTGFSRLLDLVHISDKSFIG